jgi:hypothetical protein
MAQNCHSSLESGGLLRAHSGRSSKAGFTWPDFWLCRGLRGTGPRWICAPLLSFLSTQTLRIAWTGPRSTCGFFPADPNLAHRTDKSALYVRFGQCVRWRGGEFVRRCYLPGMWMDGLRALKGLGA